MCNFIEVFFKKLLIVTCFLNVFRNILNVIDSQSLKVLPQPCPKNNN